MTRSRIGSLNGFVLAILLALGCGKTASLGKVRPDDDGGGASSGEGGAPPAGGASGDSGASGDGGASAGVSGGAGASGEGGASGGVAGGGTGGIGSGGVAGSGIAPDGGLPCRLPKPTPMPNPTPADLERAGLIHDYCAALARDNCWDSGSGTRIGEQAQGCSVDERIVACEQDTLYNYVTLVAQYAPTCDDEWLAAIRCNIAAKHVECDGAGLFGSSGPACSSERDALSTCLRGTPQVVYGSRTSCSYGIGRYAQCTVACNDDNNYFAMNCDGPPGLPLVCNCLANFRDTNVRNWDNSEFYASDCQEAAQAAADGVWCTDRLDCCIERFEIGTKVCSCGSDNGSCEARAQSTSVPDGPGTIVPICPQYEP